MHQQVVTSDVLSVTKFVHASPQAFESATAHGTLLDYPVMAFHINVKLRLLLKNFNADTFTRLSPGLFEQRFFNMGQTPFGRANQIFYPSRTHLFQCLLGWNTSIHKPGTAKLPVLFFNSIQKFLKACGISRVSR